MKKKSLNNIFAFIFLFIALLSLSGCSQSREYTIQNRKQWDYSDLREIDPVDNSLPYVDVIALYIQDESNNLRVRLDLLEMDLLDYQEIIMGINFKPGGLKSYHFDKYPVITSGIDWDIILVLPSTGDIKGYDSAGKLITGIKVRVLRDPSQDMIDISISKNGLLPESSPIDIEVFVLDSALRNVIDHIEPVNSKAIPPDPVSVSLVFWNSLRATTPAQALKAWDGAHAGPMSSRHGLMHLLEMAESTDITIGLIDLNCPAPLIALDFLGVDREVVRLVMGGIIVVSDFGCFGGEGEVVGVNDYAKYIKLEPLEAFSQEIRKELIMAAIHNDKVVIGGNFSDTMWGNPMTISSALEYIKNHPWIRTSSALEFSKGLVFDSNYYLDQLNHLNTIDSVIYNKFLNTYHATSDNPLKNLAWQHFTAILSPANPEAQSIANNYFPQLGHILSAAQWFEKPTSKSTCAIDIDWDNQNECVLSSESYFLTFELTGGYLAFSFYIDERGVHQITAPMSEVVVGLGDPMTYDIDSGPYADPALLPGALINKNEIKTHYNNKTGSNFIELYSEDTGIKKIIRINKDLLQIEWIADQAISYSIPIGLDPWTRMNMNWSDSYSKVDVNNNWIWSIKDEISIQLSSIAAYQFDTFLDSKEIIQKTEDPNFDYPSGHYLPFPFSVIKLSPSKFGYIEIHSITPK